MAVTRFQASLSPAAGNAGRWAAPKVKTMQSELSELPISTDDQDFIERVKSQLDQGKPIVVLLRYANQGGNREYFLVKAQNEFLQVLQKARSKDAITVFFSASFPVQGRVSSELKDEAIKFLEKVIQEDEDAIFLVRLDTDQIGLGLDNMKIFSKSHQIEEWFNQNPDIPVIIGLLAFWENNSAEKITAYVRDIDGQIRRGAY
jgi:hypothetical protein